MIMPLKIGYFSPLPPAQSGVVDYAATLLGELRKTEGIQIVSKHLDPPAFAEKGFDQNSFAVCLYHIGNNPLHAEIYSRALSQPAGTTPRSVVVLHDAVLTHFLLGRLCEREWIEEFVFNYGEWARGFAAELWRGRGQSASDPRYFAYPMLKRLAETARAVIVHNPAAAEAVLRHAPAARVVEIPHFCEPLSFETPSPGPLRVGVFGYLRESKRLPAILRALERARRTGAQIELMVTGSFASRDLERALRLQFTADHITCSGHLEETEFLRAAQSVDVCINLRYPSANETSGIGVRLMGMGKTVIFTDGPELARLPELSCLRVPHGPDEETLLAEYLIALAANREMGRAIGQRAARHMAQEHSLPKVAEQYWAVLKESA